MAPPKPAGKAKKVVGLIKLALEAGKATPAPPVGPALGAKGVNIMAFCKDYNAKTADKAGYIIPVEITVYDDRSFTFILKTPPASILLLKAAGVEKGSKDPKREKVGKITIEQCRAIAAEKLPDLNCTTIESAMRIIAGTAANMGIDVDPPVLEPKKKEILRKRRSLSWINWIESFIDNNALREDLRSFVSKFVREKGKEASTEGIGVGGVESSGSLIFPKDPANPQMKDQSNIYNIATVEEFLSAESITLGADEDMIDHQGKFKQKIENETEEFLEDDCGMFSQIQEAIYSDFGIKDVHEQNFEERNSEFLEHCVVKEVQNFCHGLQHVLTNQNKVLIAGVREMEWDAIELPFSAQKICSSHENFAGKCNFLVHWR
ncbi:hypothetical protein GH714_034339 [Hevea brasiliensis]|uniref:Large ribosomal subunit protein uL11c n=1 Tax=Hevea brasiliensis TaxID=3981 RepID=A0A6A6LDQ8_HEVBR|nr:hypothetical protein GH714_034339 [Hevea brasiliensis]